MGFYHLTYGLDSKKQILAESNTHPLNRGKEGVRVMFFLDRNDITDKRTALVLWDGLHHDWSG